MRTFVAIVSARIKRVLLATLRHHPSQAQPDLETFMFAVAGSARCPCGAHEVRPVDAGPEEVAPGAFGFYVHGRRLVGFQSLREALRWLDASPCLRCLSLAQESRP